MFTQSEMDHIVCHSEEGSDEEFAVISSNCGSLAALRDDNKKADVSSVDRLVSLRPLPLSFAAAALSA